MQTQKERQIINKILEDLNSTNSKTKQTAMSNIPKICNSLEPERIKSDFLPYLIYCVDQEDEESSLELAKQLKFLIKTVSSFNDVIPLLEILFQVDDKGTRKECVTTLRNSDIIENDILNLITSLNSKDDITAKLSTIDMIISFYSNIKNQEKKSELYNIINNYLKENNSPQIIKIEIAILLKKIAKYLTLTQFENIITTLQKERNDSIRIHLTEGVLSLKNSSNISQYTDVLYNVISKLKSDESWRVRLTLAEKLGDILSIKDLNGRIKTVCVEAQASFLNDIEGEVRNIACKNLENIVKFCGKEPQVEKILQNLKNLETDQVPYVRESLAGNLLKICPLIGEENTNNYITPIFLNLMKDESHNIRVALMKTLDKLHEVIDVDNFVQGIAPSFSEIINSKNWRVRKQMLETIPVFVKIVSKKVFINSFLKICLNFLTDPAYEIRESSCHLINKLHRYLEGEDFEKKLLEKIYDMKSSDSYLIRNTVTILIMDYSKDESKLEFFNKKFIPILIKLSKDKISNVRTNCALIIKSIIKAQKAKENIKDIQSTLDELKKDKDIEVIYAVSEI